MNEIATIQRKIYEIRGRKVILDRDLAALYQVETRVLNQAVKRNIERFPEDFMFQLTLKEWREVTVNEGAMDLTSQSVISNGRGGQRYLPYVFTEHGVVMLASLLRSDTAITMSVQITRAFVAMRQAIAVFAATESKIELLNERVEKLNMYIEDILRDQNDINEEYGAQLEAISMALAELQMQQPEKKAIRPIGFNAPQYQEIE